jgi:hypothetical protein
MNPTNKNAAVPVASGASGLLAIDSHPSYTNADFGVRLFHGPGYRVELRALRGGSDTVNILYDAHELDDLLAKARELNEHSYACYHTINPLKPDITVAGNDSNVARIAWLPYDIDPERPSGIAATDAEKAEAWAIAEKVIAFWRDRGVLPAIVDSGNGFYVLVPVDLALDDDGWIAGTLELHAKQFNTPAAGIDTTAKNPSRVLRVPGTVNKKGENTPERPHRLSKILAAGSRAVLADLKALPGVEELKPLPVGEGATEKVQKILACLRENFKRMKLPRYKERTANRKGADFWEFVFVGCLIEAHNDGDDSSVIGVRSDGVLAFSCFHDGHQFTWSEAKPLIEARFGSRFDFGDVYKGGTVTVGTPAPAQKLLMSPKQLRERELNTGATEQLVDGVLPRHGVNAAIGDSNIGKSPLVVQLAVCVAAGVSFLERETRQGKTVLVDFENTGLLYDMIAQTTKAVGADPSLVEKNLSIVDRDEMASLDAIVEASKDAALVVVDSFRYLTNGDEKNGGVVMPIMKKLGEQKNCWLLVHHIRKGEQQESEKNEPLVKTDSVIHWLERASGHRSIINQSTNRWAIDDRGGLRSDLLIRLSVKGRAEPAPLHLNRVFEGEQPIGYEVAKGAHLLTDKQQTFFAAVMGKTLPWEAVVAATGGSKSAASRFLTACRTYGLVRAGGGGHCFTSEAPGIPGF